MDNDLFEIAEGERLSRSYRPNLLALYHDSCVCKFRTFSLFHKISRSGFKSVNSKELFRSEVLSRGRQCAQRRALRALEDFESEVFNLENLENREVLKEVVAA